MSDRQSWGEKAGESEEDGKDGNLRVETWLGGRRRNRAEAVHTNGLLANLGVSSDTRPSSRYLWL